MKLPNFSCPNRVRAIEFSFLRQGIPMAERCFIIDAEGAQFHSQTALHILACFLAFSTPGPLADFKPIQTRYIFLFLFLKNRDKEPRIENIIKKKMQNAR